MGPRISADVPILEINSDTRSWAHSITAEEECLLVSVPIMKKKVLLVNPLDCWLENVHKNSSSEKLS